MENELPEELKDDPFEDTLRQMQQAQKAPSNSDNFLKKEPEKHDKPAEKNFDSVVDNEHKKNLEMLLDIQIDVTMEIGRSTMLLSDLLLLGQSSVIELNRLVGEDLDIMLGEKKIGKAEVIISQEKFGARIKEIFSVRDRLNAING